MQKQSVTLTDKIQIIAIVVNVVLIVVFSFWNYKQQERLATIEYDELAPQIDIYREVKQDPDSDAAFYSWIIKNKGRKAADNVTLAFFSNNELPFEECTLAVPYDRVERHTAGNYFIYEGIALPPNGTIWASCSTESGFLKAFIAKYTISPEQVPSMNCSDSYTYGPDILIRLPNLGITGSNVEPTRINCVRDLASLNN